jgi:glycosyltransferase involved in cell wall biosynthesis
MKQGYKIILNMIVKNESSIIQRCLDNLQWVDGFVISDTGSTDNTISIIEEWGRKNNKQGKVCQNPWKNFGHNRTEAIIQAKQWCQAQNFDLTKTYLLFLDADMIFQGECLRDSIHLADVWDIRQQNPMIVYANLRAVRASIEIECKCPTHEYYEISTPNIVRQLFEEVAIEDIGDGGCKQDKAERDIRMLKEALLLEPKNCRYWFYLANTHRDVHDFHNAIKAYHIRIELGGWFEEMYCAMIYKGDCHYMLQQYPEAIDIWLRAYQIDPIRGESLIRLATHFRTISQHHTAMLFIDKGLKLPLPMERQLFVEKPVYDYKFYYELSICAYYIGEMERGKLACSLLLRNPQVPSSFVESIQNNMKFYTKKKK